MPLKRGFSSLKLSSFHSILVFTQYRDTATHLACMQNRQIFGMRTQLSCDRQPLLKFHPRFRFLCLGLKLNFCPTHSRNAKTSNKQARILNMALDRVTQVLCVCTSPSFNQPCRAPKSDLLDAIFAHFLTYWTPFSP